VIPSPRHWEGVQDPHLEELECSIWAVAGIGQSPGSSILRISLGGPQGPARRGSPLIWTRAF
jgi:hypothetical protein